MGLTQLGTFLADEEKGSLVMLHSDIREQKYIP